MPAGPSFGNSAPRRVPAASRVQDYNERQRSIYRSRCGRHANLPKAENPYGPVLVCPDCGRRLKLRRSLAKDGARAYYAYVCPTYLEHGETVRSRKRIRASELERIVLETLGLHMALFLDTAEVLRRLLQGEAQTLRRGAAASKKSKLNFIFQYLFLQMRRQNGKLRICVHRRLRRL